MLNDIFNKKRRIQAVILGVITDLPFTSSFGFHFNI